MAGTHFAADPKHWITSSSTTTSSSYTSSSDGGDGEVQLDPLVVQLLCGVMEGLTEETDPAVSHRCE